MVNYPKRITQCQPKMDNLFSPFGGIDANLPDVDNPCMDPLTLFSRLGVFLIVLFALRDLLWWLGLT